MKMFKYADITFSKHGFSVLGWLLEPYHLIMGEDKHR